MLDINVGRKNPIKVLESKNGCWECLNRKPMSDGRYYLITVGSRTDGTRKIIYLHRFMYEYFIDSIPSGMLLRHTCDNTLCINPKHLLLGTHQDNSNDMVLRNRSLSGEKNPSAKLKDTEVLEIRDLYNLRVFNQTQLGTIYGVSQRQISNIVRKKG